MCTYDNDKLAGDQAALGDVATGTGENIKRRRREQRRGTTTVTRAMEKNEDSRADT